MRQSTQLAATLGLPVVATHPVQFLSKEEFTAHEARVCIADGEILANGRRVRRFTQEQYFKTQAEMAALFADIPAALANTALSTAVGGMVGNSIGTSVGAMIDPPKVQSWGNQMANDPTSAPAPCCGAPTSCSARAFIPRRLGHPSGSAWSARARSRNSVPE